MKVGVFGSSNKIKNLETVAEIMQWLREAGYEAVEFRSQKEIDGVDVVLVLGGDGAILHSALFAAQKGIKIIGVNYGTLGFLAECEKDEWEKVKEILVAMETGDCRVVKRTLLQIDVMGKTYYALNEVAIQRDYGFLSTKSTQILHLDIEVKEGRDTISGDGLLICTPTGSTAYSLSAGGPIVEPDAKNILITPICAHDMGSRCIVASMNRQITVELTRNARRNAFLSVDGGKALKLNMGDITSIRSSDKEIRLIRLKNRSFYDVINMKFKNYDRG